MTDLPPPLARFTPPPVPSGLAARIVAAATAAPPPRRRDRRGRWRYVATGVCAAALVSATAVASGIFGQLRTELAALSAPPPALRPSAAAIALVRPQPRAAVTAGLQLPPAVDALRPEPAPLVPSPVVSARLEARVARRVLLAERPELRAALREFRAEERAYRARYPELAGVLALPRAERRALLRSRPDLRPVFAERMAARRAFLVAHPEIATELQRGRTLARAARSTMPLPASPAAPPPGEAAPPATPTPDTAPQS